MYLIKKEKLNLKIRNNHTYAFEIPENGVYLIEIIASAKSWWQNLTSFKSFFQDDDLTVKIDEYEFSKLNGKKGLFDGEAAWNGNNLKGLSKTDIFLINLEKGNHTLLFSSDKNPILESIALFKIDKDEIDYVSEDNNPTQDGDRRQWITIIPVNLSIKNLNIKAGAKKYPKDDDDIKLIIDGNIQKNESDKSHKNWFWCGRILNGQDKEFNQELNLTRGLHYVELWADKMPALRNIEILINREDESENNYIDKDEIWWVNHKEMKGYDYKGIFNNEDYNRYDDLIKKAVAYWNRIFFSGTFSPQEPLDPNLVKAIIFQESQVGYDKNSNGDVNIMQVGNYGDSSLDVLNGKGENVEYEIKNGKVWKVNYEGEAKVEKIYDSIYWGTRWLYHKAQWIGDDNKKYWFPWNEAVKRYGPGTQEYVNNVFDIYTRGIDNRNKPSLKLWTIFFILLVSVSLFSFFGFSNRSIKAAVINTMDSYERAYTENVEIKICDRDRSLFMAVIEQKKDWSEQIKIGKFVKGKIKWMEMSNLPKEQSVLSAKFVNLAGFSNPMVEVYGETHAGHGDFYLYEVKNDQLKLLLRNQAVDINNDIRWSPDNYEKYGYRNCGEFFFGGKLSSSYENLNEDGVVDVILRGTKEIICDKEVEKNSENPEYSEIKVASVPVKKIFLWDKNNSTYLAE